MQRRLFIAASIKLALGARSMAVLGAGLATTVSAANPARNFTAKEFQSLVLMARALLPHDFLAEDDYVAIAADLDQQSGRNPALLTMIRDGLAAMDQRAGGNWMAAPLDRKLSVLEELQSEAFFGRILNAGIDTLYRNPEIYRTLGYQGSSVEYGGYLNRGFADIDWLPAKG